MRFIFPINDDFIKIVAHAKACTEHIPTFSQMFNGAYRFDGKTISLDDIEMSECPTGADVDLKKVPAALELVKDSGVYLLSNGSPRDIKSGDRSRVVYALNYGPEVHLGGDDYVECIAIEWAEQAIARGNKHLILDVTEDEISLVET